MASFTLPCVNAQTQPVITECNYDILSTGVGDASASSDLGNVIINTLGIVYQLADDSGQIRYTWTVSHVEGVNTQNTGTLSLVASKDNQLRE